MNPPSLSLDAFPDPRATPASIFVVVVLGAVAVYQLLKPFDIPLRAIPETLWNTFVYLAPSPLVFKLGQPTTAVDGNSSEANMFAAKNEVLRKAFGFEGNGIFKAMAGDRTLRGFGTLLKGSRSDTPAGLGNWDNSCYQNSVIQGLASLPSLEAFLSHVVSRYSNLEGDSTNGALLATILKLNDPDNHGTQLWTPAKLKSMSSWQQQDAQEYFSKVLDEVDREILKVSKEMESQQTAGLEGLAPQGETTDGGEPGNAKDHKTMQPAPTLEPLRNPLEGLLAQRVGCMTCGLTEGLSMIPFNCLTVPLDTAWDYDIKDCLNEYTKLEAIEGVECAKCTLIKQREWLRNRLTTAPEVLREPLSTRLEAVQRALDEEDFSDSTLAKKCKVTKNERVTSTKSRQAVVARAPKSLIVHVNRSVFDEMTGAQRKNYASVSFPKVLDLQPWSLGNGDVHKQADGQISESWSVDPAESMLSHLLGERCGSGSLTYGLRAVVTHYGRHENGHYICYRKHPFTAPKDESDHDEDKGNSEESEQGQVVVNEDEKKPAQESERWWRISDEDVSAVTEEAVLAQGGVFMLFYERLEPVPPTPTTVPPELEIGDHVEDEPCAASKSDEHAAVTQVVSRKSSIMTIKAHADDMDIDIPPVPPIPDYIPMPNSPEPAPLGKGVSRKSSVMTIKAHADNMDADIPPVPSMPENFQSPNSPEPVALTKAVSRKSSAMTIKAHSDDMNADIPPVPSLPQDIPIPKSPERVKEDEDEEVEYKFLPRFDHAFSSSAKDKRPVTPQMAPDDLDGQSRWMENTIGLERPATATAPEKHPMWSFTPSTPSSYDEVTPVSPTPPTSTHFFGPPMRLPPSPNTRRMLEETIEEEETEPRWTTSRSEYAPSTVATSEGGDVSDHVSDMDYESGADEGSDAGGLLELPPLPPSPQQQRQRSVMLRTAGPGTGQGRNDGGNAGDERERMGVEGLRMVAAT